MTDHRKHDAAEQGWRMFLDQQGVDLDPAPPGRRRRRRPPLPQAVLAGLGTAALVAPLAMAQTGGEPSAGAAAAGDVLRQEVRNGTTGSETEIIGQFNASTGAKGGYVTRQSNTQTGPKAGGGAIYGCRGAAGGTAAGSAPCLRASNLANGFAFEFSSNSGPAGLFDVAAATDAPFVTDGGGLVANLNADKVDGKDAGDFLPVGGKAADADKLDGMNSTEFLGATAKAADSEQLDGVDSGGFVQKSELLWALVDLDNAGAAVVRSNGATGATRTSAGNFLVTFNRDITACVIQATAADATGGGPPGPGSTPAYTVSVDNQGTNGVQLYTLDTAGNNVDPGGTDGASLSVLC